MKWCGSGTDRAASTIEIDEVNHKQMAGNDFNLDDILVDDILADLAREQEQGAPRRAPDDVDVDRLLAGLSGEAAPEEQAPKPKPPAPEEPAKREPPPRRPEQAQEPAVLDEALLREETVPLPLDRRASCRERVYAPV